MYEALEEKITIDLRILSALIDTAQRTTDLEGVYDDKSGYFISWTELEEYL